jgi:nitronate monooxygenase
MPITTRLTEKLGIEHPIVSAPMAFAGGGVLAAAVSQAGGLGLIGGGYGEDAWLEHQFELAGNAPVGCGFITWSLAKRPFLLDLALDRYPRAVMLSFGDPHLFAERILDSDALFLCQVQTMEHTRAALDAGAQAIVAQGSEAGGHGASRATMTLVPEIADHLAGAAPDVLLLAAGGIADGRGLAAALMLGADGVLMGSRFWASVEALVHPNFHRAAIASDGDATIRTSTVDTARRLTWPEPFTARVLRNDFTSRWHGREAEMAGVADREAERYYAALEEGDAAHAGVFVGEAAGLIGDVPSAGDIVRRTVAEAAELISVSGPSLVG